MTPVEINFACSGRYYDGVIHIPDTDDKTTSQMIAAFKKTMEFAVTYGGSILDWAAAKHQQHKHRSNANAIVHDLVANFIFYHDVSASNGIEWPDAPDAIWE